MPVVKEHGLDMLVLNAGVSSGLYDTALEMWVLLLPPPKPALLAR